MKPQTKPQKLTLAHLPPLPLSIENQQTDSSCKYSRQIQHRKGEMEQIFLMDCGSNSFPRPCYCIISDCSQASFQFKKIYIFVNQKRGILEANQRICQRTGEFTFSASQVLTTRTQRTEHNEYRLKSSNGS